MTNCAFGLERGVDPELPLSPDGVTYHLTARSGDLADRILLVGDPGRVAVVAEHLDKGSITYTASHREINIVTGTYNGVSVSVLSTGMGTDNIEIIVNEIHVLKEYDVARKRWRARAEDGEEGQEGIFDPSRVKIVRVGTCGSPNDEVPLGCLAITRHAVGLDNTCQYYEAPAINRSADVQEVLSKVKATGLSKIQLYATRATPAVTRALVSACESFNRGNDKGPGSGGDNGEGEEGAARRQPYYVGTTCSASGFYGCQGRSVGRFRGRLTVPSLTEELGDLRFDVSEGVERVANVEMETSSLCFLSNALGYQAGSICVVLARRSRTQRAFATPAQSAEGLRNAIQIALEAITGMS